MKKEVAVLADPEELSQHRKQTLNIQKQAAEFVVATEQDVEVGEEMLRAIRDVEDAITNRKTEITRPLMQALASARDLFKPFETNLVEAKKTVKEKVLAYLAEAELVRQKKEEEIEKKVASGKLKAETAADRLSVIEAQQSSANVQTRRKLSIVDELLIPREYLTINREAITKVLFAGGEVPGASLVEEKVLVTKKRDEAIHNK